MKVESGNMAGNPVPLSQPQGVGQRDNHVSKQDMLGTKSGTTDLKALAKNVLSRDNARGYVKIIAHPPVQPQPASTGRSPEEWIADDWREYFDERTGVAKHDGGMPRAEEERQAFEACILKWMNFNPPTPADPDTCPCCSRPCGAPGASAVPVLNPSGGHLWLHHACLEPWLARRRQEAAAALEHIGLNFPA